MASEHADQRGFKGRQALVAAGSGRWAAEDV